MWSPINLVIVCSCLLLLYLCKSIYNFIVKYKRWSSVSASIPQIPNGIVPIFGSLLKYSNINTIIRMTNEHFLMYGSPTKLRVLNWIYLVLVSEPSQIQSVCCSAADERSYYYQYADNMLDQGLITASGSRWKKTRKLLNPAFKQKILEDYTKTFIDMSNDFTEDLEKHVNQGPFDVLPLIMEYQTYVIGKSLLGATLNLEESGFNFYKYMSRYSELMLERFFVKPWLGIDVIFNMSSIKPKLNEATSTLSSYLSQIVKEKQNKLDKLNPSLLDETNNSFLDKLLQIKKDHDLYTDKQIIGEISTMFVAGIDTTSIALAFALVMVGIHKNIQKLMVQEIQTVMEDFHTPLTYKLLQKMSYTERVIKETLRLFPPVPFFLRDAIEDISLGIHTIPAESTCIVSPYLVHRNPNVWPDPLTFNPDRFLPDEVRKHHPYAYIPFGAGSRNCIGKGYAMLSIKATLVNILRTYEVTCEMNENDFQFRLEFIMKILGGYMISLSKR